MGEGEKNNKISNRVQGVKGGTDGKDLKLANFLRRGGKREEKKKKAKSVSSEIQCLGGERVRLGYCETKRKLWRSSKSVRVFGDKGVRCGDSTGKTGEKKGNEYSERS